MVRFEKDRFIIEIVTNANPIETWIETMKELSDLISSQDKEMTTNRYWVNGLMIGMMPDIDTAKKMTND